MTKKTKITCFFCSYEICNKKFRLIKFKDRLKKVCIDCSPASHKVCKTKYIGTSVDCSICNNPVMYNKCLKCDICNHMVHSKCNDISPKDILPIESLNSFTCKSCCENIFPFTNYQDTTTTLINRDRHIKQTRQIKQCFLCTNALPRKRNYTNKNIIYNGKPETLCQDCCLKECNLPVKDRKAIELLDCSCCLKQVKYEGILCELCQHWVHPECNSIDPKTLHELDLSKYEWWCTKCTTNIYPKYLMEEEPTTAIYQSFNYKTFDDCSICNKNVKSNRSICCTLCNHWVHSKCIDCFTTKSNSLNSFLNYYKDKDWFCPQCLSDALPFINLNNMDFQILCFEEMNHTSISSPSLREICIKLQTMNMFDKLPHAINVEDENNDSDNLDPDLHFKNYDNCKYIFDLKDVTQKDTSFSVLNFNIRSIRKKHHLLADMLSTVDRHIDIISISETWLTENDNILDYKLDGYHCPVFSNRQGRHGGGVMIYIHNTITNYKLNKTLSYSDNYNHCLVIDFVKNNKKHSYINCYRSPTDTTDTFIDRLDDILCKVKNNICIIAGDFNYNLLNISIHNKTEEYYNTLTAHSFKPLITKPTRIADNSKTLIDHIWSNNLSEESSSKSYIYITDISDHLPCISVFNTIHDNYNGYKHIRFREYSEENKEMFRQRICNGEEILTFHCTNSNTTLQQKYKDFFDHITRIYNDSFPIKKRKLHTKTLRKPWITHSIQKLIAKRNKLFSRKSDNDQIKKRYKTLKKDIETKLRESRKTYYRQRLNKEGDSLKSKWDTIREIINRKKNSNYELPIRNKDLGQHYSTLAKKLAQKIPKLAKQDIPSSSSTTLQVDTDIIKDKFAFNEITTRNIYETIIKLDINKGPGIDDLNVKCIKYIADIISPHLNILFNSSLEQNLYPDLFKTAKCVPIFKGADLDPQLPVSYRPISILNSLNKVFERILHDQIYKHLEIHKLLPSFQYGYRKGHNTSQAILDFTRCIEDNLKHKQTSIAVFMDLSKAFDTVDKNTLFEKLQNLGFNNSSRQLLLNYMTNRDFCFKEDTETRYKLEYGVPQGSILGPLLFIIYTYDMKYICPSDKTIVYADDTTVIISGRNLREATDKCNGILQRFLNYFNLNKLSINPSKTKYLTFHPQTNRPGQHNMSHCSVNMDNKILERVNSIKFLGVIINNKLTWDEHKQYLHRKISKTIGIIYKCKNIMTENELINIYKTFIQSNLLYAIEVWGHCIVSQSDMLIKLQNKVLRILFDCKRSQDAWRYSKGRILSVAELYEQVITRICIKHHRNQLPHYFAENIMPEKYNAAESTTYYTLRSERHRPYDYLVNTSVTSIFYKKCITIWNGMTLKTRVDSFSKQVDTFTDKH